MSKNMKWEVGTQVQIWDDEKSLPIGFGKIVQVIDGQPVVRHENGEILAGDLYYFHELECATATANEIIKTIEEQSK